MSVKEWRGFCCANRLWQGSWWGWGGCNSFFYSTVGLHSPDVVRAQQCSSTRTLRSNERFFSAALVTFSRSFCVFQSGKQKKKFSSFFKSLVIELEKELYGPDNHLVEVRRSETWNKSEPFELIKKSPASGLCVKTVGDVVFRLLI